MTSNTWSTPGSYSFTVPNYGTLSFICIGASGGGGAGLLATSANSGGDGGPSYVYDGVTNNYGSPSATFYSNGGGGGGGNGTNTSCAQGFGGGGGTAYYSDVVAYGYFGGAGNPGGPSSDYPRSGCQPAGNGPTTSGPGGYDLNFYAIGGNGAQLSGGQYGFGGGAGGGGGSAVKTYAQGALTPGTTITLVVGAAGAAGHAGAGDISGNAGQHGVIIAYWFPPVRSQGVIIT